VDLCIDERGYIDLDRSDAELLFQVLTAPREGAAIVDRLTFGGAIFESVTNYFRLAQTCAKDNRELRAPMWRTDYDGTSISPYL
jgi:hypothetical protein